MRWEQFVEEQPEFAAKVRARFVRKHCTLATLRRDGAPRISGTEVDFTEGGLHLGSMQGAVKALDLRRDPRMALHSPTEDPPEEDPSAWPGEAKISGTAHEVTDPPAPDGSHRFRVDVTEVVLTYVAGDRLSIASRSASCAARPSACASGLKLSHIARLAGLLPIRLSWHAAAAPRTWSHLRSLHAASRGDSRSLRSAAHVDVCVLGCSSDWSSLASAARANARRVEGASPTPQRSRLGTCRAGAKA